MYLRAGIFSLGLLLLSRVLGLVRESVQAAAFGSTGMADVVVVMFTLPDLLVGILLSGALGYVMLPHWAKESPAQQRTSQKKIERTLLVGGLVLGVLVWAFRDFFTQLLAPGLTGDMKALSAASLVWSAVVLPLAMIAALWVTRLQHERDFVGMYAGNLLVNLVLVSALFAAAASPHTPSTLSMLGMFLVLAMLSRLAWLAWRLPRNSTGEHGAQPEKASLTGANRLPGATVWLWAGLSSGLLLLLPLVARSLASRDGEGALASFNYAWKLVELPLVLAVQLVASIAFPAITRTLPDTAARSNALQVAFLLAWTFACAAVAIVATFSLPIASMLFGWGRMSPDKLTLIAHWGAIGIWSLLPQAVIAVLLTVMAVSSRMHVAVWAYLLGLLALIGFGWLHVTSASGEGGASGAAVMWMLDAVLTGIALFLVVAERASIARAFPWLAFLPALLVSLVLIALKPLFAGWSLPIIAVMCSVYGVVVVATGVAASPLLRELLWQKLQRPSAIPES